MALTEGFLLENGGMRGLEAASNRVYENYGATPPPSTGWTGAITTRYMGNTGYSGSFTTGSFTPTANSMVFVYSWAQNTGTDHIHAWSLTNSAGLEFIKIADSGMTPSGGWGVPGQVYGGSMSLWAAPVGASPAAATVTLSCGPSNYGFGVQVFDITNCGLAQAIVSKTVNYSEGNAESQTTSSLATAAHDGNLSLLLAGVSGDADANILAPSGWTTLASYPNNPMETAVFYRTNFTGTSETITDLGQSVGMAGTFLLEITSLPAAEVIQVNGAGGNYITATTLTTTSALTSGSLLVLVAKFGGTYTLTDSGSHTWTLRQVSVPDAFGGLYYVWTAPNTSTSACTIDLGLPIPSNYWQMYVVEVKNGKFLESSISVNAGGDGDPDTNTLTMTGHGGLGLGFLLMNGGDNMVLVTPPSDLHMGLTSGDWMTMDYGSVDLGHGGSLAVQGVGTAGYWGWGAIAVTIKATRSGFDFTPSSVRGVDWWIDALDTSKMSLAGSAIDTVTSKVGDKVFVTPLSTVALNSNYKSTGITAIDFDGDGRVLSWSGTATITGTTQTVFWLARNELYTVQRVLSMTDAAAGAPYDWDSTSGMALNSESDFWPSGYRGANKLSTPSVNYVLQWTACARVFNGSTETLYMVKPDGTTQIVGPVTQTGTFNVQKIAMNAWTENLAEYNGYMGVNVMGASRVALTYAEVVPLLEWMRDRFLPSYTKVTPASLPNLVAWYDAQDAASFTYHSGSIITQWKDKSGGGRHLANATSTSSPSRDATALGGLPGVVSPTKQLQWVGSNAVGGTAMSFAIVYKFNSGSRIISFNSSTGLDHETPGGAMSALYPVVERVGQSSSSPSVELGVGNVGVVMCVWDGANFRQYLNGVQVYTTTQTGTFDIDQINLGVNMYTWDNSDSVYGEVIVCGAAWSATDRANMLAYLKTKWGTP